MLDICDLTKRYGEVVALDGASFSVAPGRIVGFLGPNGAGKTTTLRTIFGLVRPDRGEVRRKGRPVGPGERTRRSPRRCLRPPLRPLFDGAAGDT
jgi:ABC-2 type transport system ATP-binding protein